MAGPVAPTMTGTKTAVMTPDSILALAQGTQDALLLAHPGFIAAAAHHPAQATCSLKRALALNAGFSAHLAAAATLLLPHLRAAAGTA